MGEKKFNPNEHLMQLKGRDYLQVMWRLVWFREEHPAWSIETEPVALNDTGAAFRAYIKDDTGRVLQTAFGSETKGDFGDFAEKAETKAVGRALAMLGYGTQFTALELDEGERIVDSPVDRKPQARRQTEQKPQTAPQTAQAPQRAPEAPQAVNAPAKSENAGNGPQNAQGVDYVEELKRYVVRSRMSAENITALCDYYGVAIIEDMTQEQARDFFEAVNARRMQKQAEGKA